MPPRTTAPMLLLQLILFCLFLSFAAASKTIIDLISSDPGFSRLVKELQRNRLVPFLNSRRACTFFAPTDAAFAAWERDHPGRKVTKDLLMYLVLPDKIHSDELKDQMLLETYLKGDFGDEDKGQRIAVAKSRWNPLAKIVVGEGELLEKDWKADNGVVHVVSRLTPPPEDIVEVLKKNPKLRKIHDIVVEAGLGGLLKKNQAFTLFAPTENAVGKLDDIQLRYLQHEKGTKDLEIAFHHHIHSGLVYKEDIRQGSSSLSTLEGQDLLVSNTEKLLVDNAEVEQLNILASNGVIHTVSRPLLPSALIWTAGKYLIGLNASIFVDRLRDAGLDHYIDDPKASYTIFAPLDQSFSTNGGEALDVDTLKYHVVAGLLVHNRFVDGQLISTELHTEQLNGGAQRSKVTIKKDTLLINNVQVIGDPVVVGKSIIYTLSQSLKQPLPVHKTIRNDLSLVGFNHALTTTGLGRRLADAHGLTIFAPTDSAWEKLGVVTDYLALEENKEAAAALEAVVRYSIVNQLFYTAEFDSRRTVLKTSEGSDLVVEKNGNSIYAGEGRLEQSAQVDVLVESGSIQMVSAVALPPTLSISLLNVLQGAGTGVFIEAIRASNITGILTSWDQDYTIFAPTDEAIEKANLEGAWNDKDFMSQLVRLHVVPGRIIKPEEDAYEEESSMLNSDARLSFRDVDGDGRTFGVRVKGARSKKEARIIDMGRAHAAWSDSGDTPRKTRSGLYSQSDNEDSSMDQLGYNAAQPSGIVYVIDRVLLPGDDEGFGRAWYLMIIVLVSMLATVLLCALTVVAVHELVKELRKVEGYRPVPAADGAAPAARNQVVDSDDEDTPNN
ncbi:hypothetical protein BGW38_010054 [Lunasporangiospora selenospora]|uniref:FAS1 domain-containing protein n=1 Tax=Lunasporangiospora selenospora TaxID=979761 RepID=A0A9P6G2X4_9FUNG|nr:hypothetical protein BGW38_010054 [Lunasporangiospora selenospora]